jgi:hypothetical protein
MFYKLMILHMLDKHTSAGQGMHESHSCTPAHGLAPAGSNAFERLAAAPLPMRPYKPHNSQQQDGLYPYMEAMENLFEARICFPRLPEFHAHVGQYKTPWPGTKKGVDVETPQGHLGYTSRQRDKRPNNW